MMGNTSRRLSSLVVISLPTASQIGLGCAQQSPDKNAKDQTVRLKAELVELRSVVTDKKGNPMEELGMMSDD